MRLAVVGATRRVKGLPARLRRLAARLGEALDLGPSEVTVLLTDDESIREMNLRHRGKDAPTDVLSFPAGDDGLPLRGPAYLGDLAISLDTAQAQAAEHGHEAADEAEVLFLHGVLHLLGHDHETDDGEMRRLEARLAAELLGAPRGLIARASEQRRARTGRVRR